MSKSLPPEFFINSRCPPGVVLVEAATVNVRSGEAMITSKKEVPVVVLRANISEAGKHFFAVEVGIGNEHDSFARVTEESKELGVSGGS